MRLHVVGLPHTSVTRAYSSCAYTQKVRRFCDMMTARGHELYLYAGPDNEGACTEHIACITEGEQQAAGFWNPADSSKVTWNGTDFWRVFDARAIPAILERRQEDDILCVMAGEPCHTTIAASVDLPCVEFGIGYKGVFASFRVFESHAVAHAVAGFNGSVRDTDCVIPNYYDIDEFPLEPEKDDYHLFMGRLGVGKGEYIASQVCERLGLRLIVCGQGPFGGYGEVRGLVGPDERTRLMQKATALWAPTQYLEPFGGVHAEAMLCGTPVITSDWGVFTETVQNGVNGYRCRTMAEYEKAATEVKALDAWLVHSLAADRFTYDSVAPKYEDYFANVVLPAWEYNRAP